MKTLEDIKAEIIKSGGETNALVVLEKVRRAIVQNCKEIRRMYRERQKNVGKNVDLYSAQLAAEVSALASFAKSESDVYGPDHKESSFGIYRRCLCGFRTWFDSEENAHLDETKDDVHEHKFVSVIVERDSDG